MAYPHILTAFILRLSQTRRTLRIVTFSRAKAAAGAKVSAGAGPNSIGTAAAKSTRRNKHSTALRLLRFLNSNQGSVIINNQSVGHSAADIFAVFINNPAVFQNIPQIFSIRR